MQSESLYALCKAGSVATVSSCIQAPNQRHGAGESLSCMQGKCCENDMADSCFVE